jgi:hypothetical protein
VFCVFIYISIFSKKVSKIATFKNILNLVVIMSLDLEKAQLMSVLARGKGNWGGKYDRTEHLKRFPNLNQIIKELSNTGWIIVYNKPKYCAISLNTKFKREIIEFIEKEMPYIKGMIK